MGTGVLIGRGAVVEAGIKWIVDSWCLVIEYNAGPKDVDVDVDVDEDVDEE